MMPLAISPLTGYIYIIDTARGATNPEDTTMATTETLIQEYARAAIAEFYGDDETAAPLFAAVIGAIHPGEIRALGLALCHRHDALCDTAYRIGAERCDHRVQAIADALGYDA
jgi:hypothetical protein